MGEIKDYKKEFTDAINIVHNILTKLKIQYFLLSGTLLGAVRENDFIDHDYDIDIGFFYEEIATKIESLKELLIENKFRLWGHFGKVDCGYTIQFIYKNRVRIDFVVIYKISPDTGWYGLSVGEFKKYIMYKHIIPINDKIIEYKNFKPLMVTYIPENYDELLKHEYGDYKIEKKESFGDFVNRHRLQGNDQRVSFHSV